MESKRTALLGLFAILLIMFSITLPFVPAKVEVAHAYDTYHFRIVDVVIQDSVYKWEHYQWDMAHTEVETQGLAYWREEFNAPVYIDEGWLHIVKTFPNIDAWKFYRDNVNPEKDWKIFIVDGEEHYDSWWAHVIIWRGAYSNIDRNDPNKPWCFVYTQYCYQNQIFHVPWNYFDNEVVWCMGYILTAPNCIWHDWFGDACVMGTTGFPEHDSLCGRCYQNFLDNVAKPKGWRY